MKKLLALIKRFVRRRVQKRQDRYVAEISPEAQFEIERRRGPQWPL